jgi:hypothetical protein
MLYQVKHVIKCCMSTGVLRSLGYAILHVLDVSDVHEFCKRSVQSHQHSYFHSCLLRLRDTLRQLLIATETRGQQHSAQQQ